MGPCIAYLDLLGIKELAKYKAEKYSQAMTKFTEKLFLAAAQMKSEQDIDSFKIYFFSDCAFVESASAEVLLEFFVSFRKFLTEDDPGYYFTAALTAGTLDSFSITGDPKTDNKQNDSGLDGNIKAALQEGASKFVRGTVFKSNTISSVYLMQHNFKGIGIMIDKRLELSKPIKAKFVNDSFYFPTLGYDKIETYWDVKLTAEDITEARMNSFFELYHKANKRNKKYGKYYFSMLINWVNSLKIKNNISVYYPTQEDIKKTNADSAGERGKKAITKGKKIAVFENLPLLFETLLDLDNHIVQELAAEAYHFELVYFYMLHILNAKHVDEWVTIGVIQKIIKIPACRKHFGAIDAISDVVFNYEDKEMFISQYTKMVKVAKQHSREHLK